jgi:hypothetical protein
MSLPNITTHTIATGASVQVKVGVNSDKPDTILGLASNVSYQENYNLQDAVVLGVLGPVSIDPQGYSCEITIGSFVPAKLKMGGDIYDSSITEAVLEKLPKRADIFATLKGKVFQSLEFFDKDSGPNGTTLALFLGVVLSSQGMTIEGNTYAKANIQFRAVEKVI